MARRKLCPDRITIRKRLLHTQASDRPRESGVFFARRPDKNGATGRLPRKADPEPVSSFSSALRIAAVQAGHAAVRSEERRVGKECRCREWQRDSKGREE